MNVTKLAPWNWFKKEQEGVHALMPMQSGALSGAFADPFFQMHRQVDQLFNELMRGFGTWPAGGGEFSQPSAALMKPTADVAASEKEYTITLELPGVSEKDVNVELVGDTLTISGEKRQESEQNDRDYYRMERSYGAFRRVLSLPEDADAEHINASYRNGLMTVTIPRKAVAERDTKRIEVKAA